MIHVIRRGWQDTSILSRKAEVLRRDLGWSISDRSDPYALVNYAFPYLDYRDSPKEIPFAAYFTHREDTIPGKVQIWKEKAHAAVLRVTSAAQYYEELSLYGPTVKILPPLDREKFSPGPDPYTGIDLPIIGASGFVYRGGRKGEDLLAEADRRLHDRMKFIAMGRGWPVPTQEYPYEKIQNFYRGLDVYLCTSTIEGIPYPPLEALACGVKIVIPRGVGIMDELPDLPGIARYVAGDIDSMVEALEQVITAQANPEDLREATSCFTEQAWVEGHEAAFSKLLPKRRGLRRDRGIYVVAFGDNARACARRLVRSAHVHMPTTPISVVSDLPFPGAEHALLHAEAIDGGARQVKLAAYEKSPEAWDKVIYLDADTELMESIEFFFEALDHGWEMILTKDVNSRATVPYLKRNKNREEYQQTLDMIGSEQELAIAGGVWAFRRSEGAKKFMRQWQEEWGSGRYRDQPSMLRAFYSARVKALVLGNEWNSFTDLRDENRHEIIRHYSGGAARHSVNLTASGELVYVNRCKHNIERGGLLFIPGSPVIVTCSGSRLAEIRSCVHLEEYTR